MAQYRISGVWKNSNNVITHYAFHEDLGNKMSMGSRTSKAEAIKIVEKGGNGVTTMIWNYKRAQWSMGEDVHIVEGQNGKYLRSDPDDTLTDNLGHLLDFDWIAS